MAAVEASETVASEDIYAQEVKVDEQRPVEAFVSPASLFPIEGTEFAFASGAPARYAPVTAFDRLGGAAIGRVEMTNSHCFVVLETVEGRPQRWDSKLPGCDRQPTIWYLQLSNGARHRLAHAEWTYETNGLVSYAVGVRRGNVVWSRIEHADGAFWISTAPEEVHGFEALASRVDVFDIWCAAPGRCRQADAVMRSEAARMLRGDFAIESCYSAPYQIDKVVAHRGRRYYQVTRAPVEAGSPQPRLPVSGFIPTRNRDGSHTGSFVSRGC